MKIIFLLPSSPQFGENLRIHMSRHYEPVRAKALIFFGSVSTVNCSSVVLLLPAANMISFFLALAAFWPIGGFVPGSRPVT